MRIAVEGCAHGELEIIYEALQEVERHDGKKIDLLICCGDFQSTRNLTDLACMAVPDKYKEMCTFYKYYSGEKVAPVLTIFIGGNHEASNYLQELTYGGWVAPNIYYMGYASVVNVAGVRIAGISGIYKSQDWMQGHHEKAPYNHSTIRSVYHIRNLDIFRLKQLSGNIDIFLSHDWPRGITQYGNEKALLRNKPFFKSDIESNSLGSPPCMELLEHHNPSYWFSAHLHCKFAALVPKPEDPSKVTKFLALDKCLPKRKFLQILEIPHDEKLSIKIYYDLEWLTILYLTNHLLSVKSGVHYMPGQGGNSRWIYTPTETEKENVLKKFENNLEIPDNFEKTSSAYNPDAPRGAVEPPCSFVNPQTTLFTDKLGIDDPLSLLQILSYSKDNSFNKSSDTKNTSFTFEEDNAMNSTLDEDSPDETAEESNAKLFFTDTSMEKRISVDESDAKRFFADTSMENRISVEESDAKLFFADTSIEKENSVGESVEEEFPVVAKDAKEENKTKDEVGELIQTKSVDENVKTTHVEPNCKKFKRRNHSLYSDNL